MLVMSILLILLACCLHSILALQCQKCFSYKSMEDCTKNLGTVECAPDQTRCKNTTVSYAVNMAYLEETITGYVRGCETEKNCKEEKCEEGFGEKLGASKIVACEISCCEGNFCPKDNSTESQGAVVKGARSGANKLMADNYRHAAFCSALLSIVVLTA